MGSRLFPGRVRLWHFVAFPTLAMGGLVVVFRLLERWTSVADVGGAAYPLARSLVISVIMASLIGWLAMNYRRAYEMKLQARNADLEATQEFLNSIIQGSGEAIISEDDAGRVTSWNRAAEQMFGWTEGEIRGRRLDVLLPPGDEWATEWDELDRRTRAGEVLRHHETERVRKDGRRMTVHITRAALYRPDGSYRGSVGVLHDASDLRAMQERLREQERLAAVGQLAATMAHEIKNPLAGIRGACEIMARGYADDDPRKELAREVLGQVDRLNDTTRGLLEFARPRAKHPLPTDVHEVLDRAARVLAEDARHTDIVIERSYATDLPQVHVDPQQLEEAFLNLLLNACQAMQGHGRIRLSTQRNSTCAVVRVADDGPGLSVETAKRIFEPFFTTRASGTGLGLAIVRNVVLDHGGTIEARSNPDGGACFELLLPLMQQGVA